MTLRVNNHLRFAGKSPHLKKFKKKLDRINCKTKYVDQLVKNVDDMVNSCFLLKVTGEPP